MKRIYFLIILSSLPTQAMHPPKHANPTYPKEVYGVPEDLKQVPSIEIVKQRYNTFWNYLQKMPVDILNHLIGVVTYNQRTVSEEDDKSLTLFFSKSHPRLHSSLYIDSKSEEVSTLIKHTPGIRRLSSLVEKRSNSSEGTIFHYPTQAIHTPGRSYPLDVRFEQKTFVLQDDEGLLFGKWVKKAQDEPVTVTLKRFVNKEWASPTMKTILRSRRGACFCIDHTHLRILKVPRNWHTNWSTPEVVNPVGSVFLPVLSKCDNCILTEWERRPYRLYIYLKNEKGEYKSRLDLEWPFYLEQFRKAPHPIKRYIILQLAFMNNHIPLDQQHTIKKLLFSKEIELKMARSLSPFITKFFEVNSPGALP